jgi:hypothetical protein
MAAAWLALALAGCSLVGLTDRYGNTYGGWYNPGQQYGWQLAACDREVAAGTVPAPERKLAMRCCMWRRGVPIDDPADCRTSAAADRPDATLTRKDDRPAVDRQAGGFLS